MVLNPAYVLIPLQELIRRSQSNVLLGLRLVEKADGWPPPTDDELKFAQFSFGGGPVDLRTSKARFKSWVLLNGFSDIHKSLRIALERIFVLGTTYVRLQTERNLDIAQCESDLRVKARSFHFPELAHQVTSIFGQPLAHLTAIESFNYARNCLEHTNGQVTARHCNNPEKDKLTIYGNRFRYFFKRDELEVVAELGKPGPENAALMLGAEGFEITFSLHQTLDLSLKQFIDILNTCVFICADIEVKFTSLFQSRA